MASIFYVVRHASSIFDNLDGCAVLGFGGLYHAIFGPEILTSEFFAYSWKDKNQMTTILGIHLILLGLGAWLLVLKAMSYGGLYDPWSPGGGDVRIVGHGWSITAI